MRSGLAQVSRIRLLSCSRLGRTLLEPLEWRCAACTLAIENGMRSPKRQRPMRHEIVDPPADVDLHAVAQGARYVGSSEHKSFPSFAGPPKLRADASKCDPQLRDPRVLTAWLRAGVEAGQIGAPWEGRFPRYVWYHAKDVYYEARLVNRITGTYKGYPIQASEFPESIR